MLREIKKSVILTASSEVNGHTIGTFTCHISSDGIAEPISQFIHEVDNSKTNREIVGQDQAGFQELVWETENKLVGEYKGE